MTRIVLLLAVLAGCGTGNTTVPDAPREGTPAQLVSLAEDGRHAHRVTFAEPHIEGIELPLEVADLSLHPTDGRLFAVDAARTLYELSGDPLRVTRSFALLGEGEARDIDLQVGARFAYVADGSRIHEIDLESFEGTREITFDEGMAPHVSISQ